MSKEHPLVSVMMPVYNGEGTIRIALGSLLCQTYTNWECIIVDDGSTDNTMRILDSYQNDPRFRIIKFSENRGRPVARQAALENARGTYLCYLDADDFIHSNKLERQVAILENDPTLALTTSRIGSYGSDFQLRGVRAKRPPKRISFKAGMKFKPSRQAAMIRLSANEGIQYNTKLKFAEDTDFLSRFVMNKDFLVTDDILYYYSEFSSVTGGKILEGYKYAIMRTASGFKEAPFFTIRGIVTICIKYIVTFLLIPIVGDDFFLKRRSSEPSSEEVAEFNGQISKIRNCH